MIGNLGFVTKEPDRQDSLCTVILNLIYPLSWQLNLQHYIELIFNQHQSGGKVLDHLGSTGSTGSK